MQNLIGQTNTKRNYYKLDVPANSWHLRVNPLRLIDFIDPSISVGAEYRIKERLALGADISYIYWSNYFENKKGATGFSIRPAIKYYTSQEKRVYFETELMYKQNVFKIYDWAGMDCVNGVSSYSELRNFKLKKNTYAIHAKLGRIGMLSKNNAVSIDYYIGIGVRHKSYKLTDLPAESCYRPTGALGLTDINGESNRFLPSVALGGRLMIKL